MPARTPHYARRLLCGGRGHPAERRRGRPSPQGAGTCSSRVPHQGGTLSLKTVPGGDLKATTPRADTLGSLRVCSSFYSPPRASVCSAPLAAAEGPCGAWTLGSPDAEEGGSASRGWRTRHGSVRLTVPRVSPCVPGLQPLLSSGRARARPQPCRHHRGHQLISVQQGGGLSWFSWAEFCVS